MRGKVVQFTMQQGFGRVALSDGREMTFDAAACPSGIPGPGGEVEVEISEGPRGLRVKRLVPIASGKTERRFGLLQHWDDPAVCVCYDPSEKKVQRLVFSSSVWSSRAKPRHGGAVVCTVSGDRYAHAVRGWDPKATIAVEPVDEAEIPPQVLEVLRATLEPTHGSSSSDEGPGDVVSLVHSPTRFSYLCDGGAALESNPPSATCQVCGKQPGRLGFGTSAGRKVEVACDACVTAGRVESITADDFAGFARAAHPDWSDERRLALGAHLAGLINRVPRIVVQLQETDWPICRCSDQPTDYVGTPANRVSFSAFVDQGARRYERGRLAPPGEIERLEEGDPEDWTDVACFMCPRCPARFFTDQFVARMTRDLEAVLARLPSTGTPAHDSARTIGWLAQAPLDYQTFVSRFGGARLCVFSWTLPPVKEMSTLDDVFCEGGAPPHLAPFAEQDGTWFMAFDLSAQPPRLVRWDHEEEAEAAAEPYAGSFTAWLDEQLDLDAEVEHEEAEYAQMKRGWTSRLAPFCDSPLGKQVSLRVQAKDGDALRDVLLDLHLQYTFHPRVVVNNGVTYAGLLHFKDDALGCWRCGAFNATSSNDCASCSERLLRRTYADSKDLPRKTEAQEPPFAEWATPYVNLDAPVPVRVQTLHQPEGIPKWARLIAFGGTRDPRVVGKSL